MRLVDEQIWEFAIQLLSLDAKRQAIIERLAASPQAPKAATEATAGPSVPEQPEKVANTTPNQSGGGEDE